MKIPLFSKLKARPGGRRVVRASAARALREDDEGYYEAEPNMKLSHAFMVVLVLHIVAVGGIYAFNKVKVQKNPDILANISGRIAQATGTSAAPTAPLVTTSQAAPAPEAAAAPARDLPPEADEPLPAVVTSMRSTPPALAPAATPAAPAKVAAVAAPAAKAAPAKAAERSKDAGSGTYEVAKGDNPYKIAKKLGVKYQDLLSLNGITDPTKLQIGQVLKVPAKAN
jgi:LysM repeat protein